jgi:hypothetical protein
MAQLDAIAEHRNAFPKQELALSLSHRATAVSADHAMPWEAFVNGGKYVTHQAGRFRIDVAVGADKPSGNRSHPSDDARRTRGVTSGFRYLGSNGPLRCG